MSFDDYLLHMFCLIDQGLTDLARTSGPLRHHGRSRRWPTARC